MIVGVFNPLSQLTLVEENVLPIGDILAPLVMSINACLKSWAEDYDCTFVDISNVETGSVYGYSVLNGNPEMALATHPSFPDGYDYISRQIVNAIPEKKVDCTIRVDLGTVKSVSSVTLDGRKLSAAAYSFDGHMLTIPNIGTFNNSLIVTGMKGNKIYVNTYTLSFDVRSGYTAYLLYSTNDVVGTVTTLAKSVVSAVSSIFKK